MKGGCHVVVVAPEGLKTELAKKLGAGDVYVELWRKNPSARFERLERENPCGTITFLSQALSCQIFTAIVYEGAPGSRARSSTFDMSLHAGFLLLSSDLLFLS